MAEKKPWQKWSISNLWEHFWVPEHRVPIWLLSGSFGKQCKHEKYWYFSRRIAILEIALRIKVAKPLCLQRDSNVPTS